ncbi:MAG: MFS transporter [Betaproteobacteria bacterium]|nr:MAG: MFS transporter [Betaproteobacteria bacterium]
MNPRPMLLVFCPFAAGYFLSFFFRNVNAVISKDLAREFSLAPSDLGFLTSMYLLAFAAFQLPLGVLLDRYGPRRVLAVLYSIAGAGALIFGVAQDFTTLSIGRALIGLGVSGGLMGAIKAFTMWFPLSRLATLNGLYLAVGGIGGLSATAPVEALLGPLGWRALFYCVAGLSVMAAALIFFVVPEKPPPGRGETLAIQIRRFGEIFSTQKFWRIALPLVVCHAGYQALQGLWLGPWLYDVAELPRAAVANYLLVTAIAFTVGSVFFGVTSDRLAAAGVSRMTMFKLGQTVSLAMFVLLAAGVKTGLFAVLAVYGFTAISAALAYALLTPLFGPEMTGRVNTASNVLMFGCSFLFQWGIGAVLRAYPVLEGRYAPEGYATALVILAVLQALVIAWLLPMREPSARKAGP